MIGANERSGFISHHQRLHRTHPIDQTDDSTLYINMEVELQLRGQCNVQDGICAIEGRPWEDGRRRHGRTIRLLVVGRLPGHALFPMSPV